MHEKSIELLNEALADELWSIHQYMYFHFHCDDQGFDPLAALFKTLDSLDKDLAMMEEYLQEGAAAIKPLTDDCADIEEENRDRRPVSAAASDGIRLTGS